MPRPGPRRPAVVIKLAQAGIEHIDERAGQEAAGNRSEMIRRMLAYAALKMPQGWKP